MKSDLAIATLIRSRKTELGLSRRRICKAPWLQEHCKRHPPDRRLVRRRPRRNEAIFGYAAAGPGRHQPKP